MPGTFIPIDMSLLLGSFNEQTVEIEVGFLNQGFVSILPIKIKLYSLLLNYYILYRFSFSLLCKSLKHNSFKITIPILITFFVSLKTVQPEPCVQRLREIDTLPELFCYHCFHLFTRFCLCSILGFCFLFHLLGLSDLSEQ